MKSDEPPETEYSWQPDGLLKVYVFRQVKPGSLRMTLVDALTVFENAMAKISEEYRGTAELEVSLYDEPGGPHPELSAFYFRPPNAKELREKARINSVLAEQRMVTQKINRLAALPPDKAVPALIECLKSSNNGERQRAVDHLSNFQGTEVIRALRMPLDDASPTIRFRAMLGLSKLAGRTVEGGVWTTPKLREIKADENRYLRHWKKWAESFVGGT